MIVFVYLSFIQTCATAQRSTTMLVITSNGIRSVSIAVNFIRSFIIRSKHPLLFDLSVDVFAHSDSSVRFGDFELNFYFKSKTTTQITFINWMLSMHRFNWNVDAITVNSTFISIKYFTVDSNLVSMAFDFPGKKTSKIKSNGLWWQQYEQRKIVPTQCVHRFECKTPNGMVLLLGFFSFYCMFIFARMKMSLLSFGLVFVA